MLTTVAALRFITNQGTKMTINVPRANPVLTDTAAMDAMDGIIASGIVVTSGGRPLTKDGAELIKTSITQIV